LKILFDHNAPAYLLKLVPGATTAHLLGWVDLSNGRLLEKAESDGFEVLVTLDRGFQSQQNLTQRRIGIVILATRDQSRVALQEVGARLAGQLDGIEPGSLTIFV
jgi:predicted nuclease of predicted toxin-antitoxin system